MAEPDKVWAGGITYTQLHSTLAYVSPMRFEENWLANQLRPANA